MKTKKMILSIIWIVALSVSCEKNSIFGFSIKIKFQFASIECSDSPVGYTPRLLNNAHASISCNYHAWLSFLEDAQGNIFDILRELDMRSKNLLQSYGIFNQSAVAFTYDRPQINQFHLSTSSYISQLKANLINFNQTLNAIDNQIQSTIDRLTNNTYMTCIDSIQDSIIKNKSCTPDILAAQDYVFAATSDGIDQCFRKSIDFHPFNGVASWGLRIPTKTFVQFIACATGNLTQKQKEICLKSGKNQIASNFGFEL